MRGSAVRVRLVAQGSELSSGFVFLRENRKGFPSCNLLTISPINFTPKFKATLWVEKILPPIWVRTFRVSNKCDRIVPKMWHKLFSGSRVPKIKLGITYLSLLPANTRKSGREKKCLNFNKILELCGDTCRLFCVKIRWVGTLSIMPTIRFHKV